MVDKSGADYVLVDITSRNMGCYWNIGGKGKFLLKPQR